MDVRKALEDLEQDTGEWPSCCPRVRVQHALVVVLECAIPQLRAAVHGFLQIASVDEIAHEHEPLGVGLDTGLWNQCVDYRRDLWGASASEADRNLGR